MRIALISVSGRLPCDGARLISSLLKRAGHDVTNIYLPRTDPDYELAELRQLQEVLRYTDLVMIAVYSNYSKRAVKITRFIHDKYQALKVIWGGPHCISVPETESSSRRWRLFFGG